MKLLYKFRKRQKRERLLEIGAGAAYAKFIQRLGRKISILPRIVLPLRCGQRLELFCRHGARLSRHIFQPILFVTVLQLLLLSELFVMCARDDSSFSFRFRELSNVSGGRRLSRMSEK